MLFHILIWGA